MFQFDRIHPNAEHQRSERTDHVSDANQPSGGNGSYQWFWLLSAALEPISAPIVLAGRQMPNRIAMAPLTRQDALHWSSLGWRDNRNAASGMPVPTVLRSASGLPTVVNGGIADGPEAATCLASGTGDMVAVGRLGLTHPDGPFIVRSGAEYDWLPFDRKYVVRPALDYGIAYPVALTDPQWPNAL